MTRIADGRGSMIAAGVSKDNALLVHVDSLPTDALARAEALILYIAEDEDPLSLLRDAIYKINEEHEAVRAKLIEKCGDNEALKSYVREHLYK